MKIVESPSQISKGLATGTPVRPNVDHAIDILHPAFDHHPRMSQNFNPLLFEKIRHDDDIRDTRLIFQAHEQDPFGCSGPLTHDDIAGHADYPAVRNRREFRGWNHPQLIHFNPAICHRVFADRQPGAGMIGHQPLFETHLPQRSFRGGFR